MTGLLGLTAYRGIGWRIWPLPLERQSPNRPVLSWSWKPADSEIGAPQWQLGQGQCQAAPDLLNCIGGSVNHIPMSAAEKIFEKAQTLPEQAQGALLQLAEMLATKGNSSTPTPSKAGFLIGRNIAGGRSAKSSQYQELTHLHLISRTDPFMTHL